MSKKYVIDLPDDAQYILINGSSENHCYTRVEQVDDLEELNSDYINEHYGELQDDAYKRGYKNGRNVGIKDGMCEAWEAARKIALMDTETSENVTGYFGLFRIMENLTPMQAIAKLKAYEDKQKDRIEVGDEVRFLPNDRKGIVTACHVPDVYAENDKYAVFCGTTVEYVLRQHITKTGKHYDIASILEAMRE